MSICTFIASDRPLKEIKNPYYKTLSINEARQLGIEVPELLQKADIDPDTPDVILWSDTELIIENGTVFDGDAEDNYALLNMDNAKYYSNKEYGVYIEWHYCTEKRAQKIIEYIADALLETDTVEMWSVWLSEYNPPIIKTFEMKIEDLKPCDITKFLELEMWNNKEPDTPTYYCLKVSK